MLVDKETYLENHNHPKKDKLHVFHFSIFLIYNRTFFGNIKGHDLLQIYIILILQQNVLLLTYQIQ